MIKINNHTLFSSLKTRSTVTKPTTNTGVSNANTRGVSSLELGVSSLELGVSSAKVGVSYYSVHTNSQNTNKIREVENTTGVSYYNKDNKDNEDNKNNANTPHISSIATLTEPDGSDITAAEAAVNNAEGCAAQADQTPIRIGHINPALLPEDVDRCLLTFYDNGENAKQRYKLAITINPNASPSTRYEFVANLNKDPRIFKRNVPPENAEFVLGFGTMLREKTKDSFNTYPLLGKVHANSKIKDSVNRTEDGCAVAVYWTGTEWRASVMLWEYMIQDISLTDSGLTEKQKRGNVKAVSGVIWGDHSVSKQNWEQVAAKTFKDKMSNRKI